MCGKSAEHCFPLVLLTCVASRTRETLIFLLYKTTISSGLLQQDKFKGHFKLNNYLSFFENSLIKKLCASEGAKICVIVSLLNKRQ